MVRDRLKEQKPGKFAGPDGMYTLESCGRDAGATGAYLCSPNLCSPVPMFPGTYVPRTYVPQYLCSPVPMFPDLRLTTAVHCTPPRLIFLSLQLDLIIVIFALVVTVSVR